MKYIRTKDKIFDTDNMLIPPRSNKSFDMIADTIEELCDGYIIENKHNPAIWYEMPCQDFDKTKANLELWNIYVYIKTDKGLIYVAKMKGVSPNGEIDWELL